MIPETIHHVWCGPGPLRDDDLAAAERIRRFLPQWTLVLHVTDPSLKPASSPYTRIDVVDVAALLTYPIVQGFQAQAPIVAAVATSDLVRLEVLLEHGGVYLDTDVFLLRECGTELRHAEMVVADEPHGRYVGNYLIGCHARAPELYRTLSECRRRYETAVRQRRALSPVDITGPAPLDSVVRASPRVSMLPYPLFAPWSGQYRLTAADVDRYSWPRCSLGVHAFAGRWHQFERRVSSSEGVRP